MKFTESLETERLIIREFEPSDLADFTKLVGDTETTKYLIWPTKNIQQAKDFFNRIVSKQDKAKRKKYIFAIVSKDTKEFIGFCRLNVKKTGNTYLSYIIKKDFWGKGIATETSIKMIDLAFNKFNSKSVKAISDQRNEASIHLLKKLGFYEIKRVILQKPNLENKIRIYFKKNTI